MLPYVGCLERTNYPSSVSCRNLCEQEGDRGQAVRRRCHHGAGIGCGRRSASRCHHMRPPPVDDARLGSKPRQRFGNQRETICQVAARSAVEPHLGTVLAGDNSAIILDLVQPHRPERRLLGSAGRRDETGAINRTRHKTEITSHSLPLFNNLAGQWPGKRGAGRGPWERELDLLPTLWWSICAKR